MTDESWRELNLKRLGYKNYERYLASRLWENVRNDLFDRYGPNCRLCQDAATHVLFLKYSIEVFLGGLLTELVPLCQSCYKMIESPGGRKYTIRQSEHLYNLILLRKPAEVQEKHLRCKTCNKLLQIISLNKGYCSKECVPKGKTFSKPWIGYGHKQMGKAPLNLRRVRCRNCRASLKHDEHILCNKCLKELEKFALGN